MILFFSVKPNKRHEKKNEKKILHKRRIGRGYSPNPTPRHRVAVGLNGNAAGTDVVIVIVAGPGVGRNYLPAFETRVLEI